MQIQTVTRVVKAWDDRNVNVHELTEDIVSCMYVFFEIHCKFYLTAKLSF